MDNIKKTRKCEHCKAKFRDNYNLNRHLVSVHGERDLGFSYICSYCYRKFHQKSNLSSHLKTVHDENSKTFGVRIPMNLYFNSTTEFDEWKDKIEKETIAKFVRRTRSYCLKDGTKRTVYSCHRSGNFKSRSLGKRKSKLCGSNKINDYCPAKIISLNKTDGKIQVLFFSEHFGHAMEPSRISLNKKERAEIFKQIASKEITQDVVISIQNGTDISRTQLLTKKDLYNIRNEFNNNKELTSSNDENNSAVNYLIIDNIDNDTNIKINNDETELKLTNDEVNTNHLTDSSHDEFSISNDNLIECNYIESIKSEIFGDFLQFLGNIENLEQALAARKLFSSLPHLVNSLTTNVSQSYDIVISVVSNELQDNNTGDT